MEKRLTYSYNKEADELNISIGKPQESISLEIDDEIYLKLHPRTKEIMGFTVLHFEQRFKNKKKMEAFPLPVTARFSIQKKELAAYL